MNRRMALQFTAPAVLIGLLLFSTCLAGAWYVGHLQHNIARLWKKNVAALEAAQDMEMRVRRLRFYCLLYLLDPQPKRLVPVFERQAEFEQDLENAKLLAETNEERECIRAIANAYQLYLDEQAQLRKEVLPGKSSAEILAYIDAHPIQDVVDSCNDLLALNQSAMQQIAQDSEDASQHARILLLLAGIGGSLGGLVMGVGVTRGLNRSILQLSVRIQDIAQRLDQDVGSVKILAAGDLRSLDHDLQHVLRRVEEVTERMQQHQREMLRAEQLAAVGQLAASVAHEVRNPLTAVKMLISLADRPNKPKPLSADDIRVIHREISRLEGTVQNLLDFARLPTPQRRNADLRDVADPSLELVRGRARQQNVEIDYHRPDEVVPVFVDVEQLRTVLINLFMNALDAMPRGGRLSVHMDQGDGETVLRVSDTGAGIAPEILPKLFTPFASTKSTGTGLGLSLSHRIIEENDGQLTAANLPTGGAQFTIRLKTRSAVVSDAEKSLAAS
jgi:signal transduction histidine kinase